MVKHLLCTKWNGSCWGQHKSELIPDPILMKVCSWVEGIVVFNAWVRSWKKKNRGEQRSFQIQKITLFIIELHNYMCSTTQIIMWGVFFLIKDLFLKDWEPFPICWVNPQTATIARTRPGPKISIEDSSVNGRVLSN